MFNSDLRAVSTNKFNQNQIISLKTRLKTDYRFDSHKQNSQSNTYLPKFSKTRNSRESLAKVNMNASYTFAAKF